MEKFKPSDRKELIKLVDDLNIHLGDIDIANIKHMQGLFSGSQRTDFSGIENWDVSKVTIMDYMFANSQFNGDISKWDVSRVRSMQWIFENCPFHGDISSWNVSNLDNPTGMFKNSPLANNSKLWPAKLVPHWFSEEKKNWFIKQLIR